MSAFVHGYNTITSKVTPDMVELIREGIGRAICDGATVSSFIEFMAFDPLYTQHWVEIVRQTVWRGTNGKAKLTDHQIIHVLFELSRDGEDIWGNDRSGESEIVDPFTGMSRKAHQQFAAKLSEHRKEVTNAA